MGEGCRGPDKRGFRANVRAHRYTGTRARNKRRSIRPGGLSWRRPPRLEQGRVPTLTDGLRGNDDSHVERHKRHVRGLTAATWLLLSYRVASPSGDPDEGRPHVPKTLFGSLSASPSGQRSSNFGHAP